MDVVLREAETLLTSTPDAVGARHASRIWGLISKFVMVDRFSKAFGVAEVYPGIHVRRKISSSKLLGTASKVSPSL